MKQKYIVGQNDIWLREIDGAQKPIQEVEIIGFEPKNNKSYRIRYQIQGDDNFWIEDVEEFRLIYLPDGLLEAIQNQLINLLSERLKQIGIDINTEKNIFGNHLKASLALANYNLNFEKGINDLTDEDLYQLGSSIIVTQDKGVTYTRSQIITKMKELLKNK
ncbi:hypothetical protein [Sphingobacterium siyangense]|uniref:hypothetical protein n=1 Tax=Sphingobacterium siyangense TaxID=459529 RepID=UPI0028B0ED1E|nr:hypothetical protein [Sphingobacterium siyangense]